MIKARYAVVSPTKEPSLPTLGFFVAINSAEGVSLKCRFPDGHEETIVWIGPDGQLGRMFLEDEEQQYFQIENDRIKVES